MKDFRKEPLSDEQVLCVTSVEEVIKCTRLNEELIHLITEQHSREEGTE